MDLRELIGTELRWVRTRFLPRGFALRWNEYDVGTLDWQNLYSSRALARTATGAWHLRRSGFRGVAIEDVASGAPVGQLLLGLFGKGTLTLGDGRVLELRRTSLIPPVSVFRTDATDVVTVRGRIAALWRGGYCRLEAGAAEQPEAALVALLGIYVLVRRARRRAR